MIVHAELSCLNCGYDMGDVEGPRGAPAADLIFLPMHQGDRLMVDKRGHFQCPRCGGRVLPHGVTPVSHPLDPASVFEADMSGELTRALLP
jgi:DNA-directed RNA polymerase subunit RPC12/RpoP